MKEGGRSMGNAKPPSTTAKGFFIFCCVVLNIFALTFLSGLVNTLNDSGIACDTGSYLKPRLPNRKLWQGCPDPGTGRASIVVVSVGSTFKGGRTGNQVWEYLSAWAAGKRYGLWPVMTNETYQGLKPVFEDLSLPMLEEMALRCGLPHLLTQFEKNKEVKNQREFLKAIEKAGPGVSLVKLRLWICATELLAPLWPELKYEMTLRAEHQESAARTMAEIRHGLEDKWTFQWSQPKTQLTLVGVHVRLTDYVQHVQRQYPGCIPFTAGFYLHAMDYMRRLVQPAKAIFVVSGDDIEWCKENLLDDDVIIAGTGNLTSPGHDLALLGSCENIIFAYGSFALTAAMLVDGEYVVLYDTQRNTHSKEAEFVQFLAGWHVMNNHGSLVTNTTYRTTYLHSRED